MVPVALTLVAAASKVPFYVAGGLLAGWAVTMAAFGIAHPDFPASAGAQRGVMGLSALLVAATIATAVITGSGPSAAKATTPAGGASTVAISADPTGNLAYTTKTASAKAGTVTIDFTNTSPVPHNVTVAQGSTVLGATKTIAGGSAQATVRLAPGTYTFYCSVDAHRAAGMQGTLTAR